MAWYDKFYNYASKATSYVSDGYDAVSSAVSTAASTTKNLVKSTYNKAADLVETSAKYVEKYSNKLSKVKNALKDTVEQGTKVITQTAGDILEKSDFAKKTLAYVDKYGGKFVRKGFKKLTKKLSGVAGVVDTCLDVGKGSFGIFNALNEYTGYNDAMVNLLYPMYEDNVIVSTLADTANGIMYYGGKAIDYTEAAIDAIDVTNVATNMYSGVSDVVLEGTNILSKTDIMGVGKDLYDSTTSLFSSS